MVKKYIILCGGEYRAWETPRQLIEINNEKLIERTIRLLKENGIKDIYICTDNPIFKQFNVSIIEYASGFVSTGAETVRGYWLDAFPPIEEPTCFLLGDVYFSEEAIKTIVKTDTESVLFFCAYKNKDKRYMKHYDEPFGFKVEDYKLFKKHVDLVKSYKDKGLCCREPIAWELYRSINGQDINVHKMTKNYVAINDETCDIDSKNDVEKLKRYIGGNRMIKVEVIKPFTLEKFNELKNVKRSVEEGNLLNIGDTFECTNTMCDYLTGENRKKEAFVKVIEVIPDEEVKPVKKRTTRRKTTVKK